MQNRDAVIFHIGRCGSTVLCHSLNQHSLIECKGEIFNPYMKKKQQGEPIPDACQIIREVVEAKSKSHLVIEVKFLSYQHPGILDLKLKELVQLFLQYGFEHFVILERKNHLRRMISHCVAQQTKVFHLRGNSKASLNPIHLNLERIAVGTGELPLMKWLEIFTEAHNELSDLLQGFKRLTLTYEEDIQYNALMAYSRVCDFLGLESEPASIIMNKTNPFPVKEILTNYEEVVEYLEGTPFEWMLVDEI